MLITRVLEKQKKKRLSLKTQFKIEFLLPFTGSRKVLVKMLAKTIINVIALYETNINTPCLSQQLPPEITMDTT